MSAADSFFDTSVALSPVKRCGDVFLSNRCPVFMSDAAEIPNKVIQSAFEQAGIRLLDNDGGRNAGAACGAKTLRPEAWS